MFLSSVSVIFSIFFLFVLYFFCLFVCPPSALLKTCSIFLFQVFLSCSFLAGLWCFCGMLVCHAGFPCDSRSDRITSEMVCWWRPTASEGRLWREPDVWYVPPYTNFIYYLCFFPASKHHLMQENTQGE